MYKDEMEAIHQVLGMETVLGTGTMATLGTPGIAYDFTRSSAGEEESHVVNLGKREDGDRMSYHNRSAFSDFGLENTRG